MTKQPRTVTAGGPETVLGSRATPAARSRRPLARAVAATAGLVILGLATPAHAHTELVSSTPAPQSRQQAPPAVVELRFSTAVDVPAGAVRVFDPSARRVDTGAAAHPAGDARAVSVTLSGGLGPGTYTTSWRVVADDGHPLAGAFTFRVGTAGQQTAATGRSIGSPSGSGGVVGGLMAAFRWLMYAGLIALVGGVAFVELLWPGGRGDRRTARLLWAAWVAAVAGTVGGLLLQGPNATSRGPAAVFDAALLREVLGNRFGAAGLVRLGLLLVAAAFLALQRRGRSGARVVVPAAAVGLALLVTPTVTGHAATADSAGLAMTVDAVHLVALALWLGGLAVLSGALLRAGTVDRAVVARFSRLAFVCVVVVAGTGVAQAWREVGSAGALTDTRYGTLLIVKVVLFVVLVGAAALSRRWVRGRVTRDTTRSLRGSVGAEVAVAAVVLALAALLVAAPPARTAYAKPFRTQLRIDPYRIAVHVSPAKAGPVTLDVRTSAASGADAPVTFVTIDLRLPAYDIGPLRVRMQRVTASHYRATGIDLPLPGRWLLDAEVFLPSGKSSTSTSFDVT